MSEGYSAERRLLQALKKSENRYLDERTLLEDPGLAEVMDDSTESACDLERTVEVLRLQGYQIDGDSTRGWKLISSPDTISRFELEEELNTTFLGRCLFTYRVIGSTNRTARALAESGVPDGTLLISEEQTDGVGRRGSGWHSPAGGGLWASLVLRPGLGPRQMGSVGMLAALSICLAVEDTTGLKPSIKWPNDLMLDGKKLGGVLCEADWRGEQLRYLVLGFGLNVNIQCFPGTLAGTAVALSQIAGKKIERPRLLAAIMERLEQGYFQLLADGFASFLPRVQVRDFLKGRRVLVEFENGERLEGVARGIDEHGALLIEQRLGDRPRAVSSGHIIQY